MSLTLSIIIPAYNAGPFIEETIRAVVDQSRKDWELIVINNASKDNTAEILEKLQSELNDARIRIMTNATTLPAVESWNLAIREAKGEFIKLICADDIPSSDSLERQVNALRNHPTAVLATGARTIINSHGKKLFTRNSIRKDGLHKGKDIVRTCIMSGTNIIGDPVHVMWRRTAMDRVGLFDPAVPYSTDIEYWLRLLSVGDLYYDSDPVGLYRIHGKAGSAGQWKATARHFILICQMQMRAGNVMLTKVDFFVISIKAYLQGAIRQTLYRFLG